VSDVVVPNSVPVVSDSQPSQQREAPQPKGYGQDFKEAAKAPEAKPEAVVPRKIKVKVDGNESEIDEAELVSRYQKSTSAEKKFQEASQKMKQTEAFMKQLKEDPISVLNNPALGLDFRRVAESYLEGILQDELMDPKDKKLRDTESELEKYRREDKQRREDAAREQEVRRAEEFERLKTKHAEEYTKSFSEALETEGLPKSPQTVRRMAQYMEQAIKAGVKVSAAEVAALVKDDYIQEQRALMSGMDAERLAELLGEEGVSKLRARNVASLKSGAFGKSVLPSTPSSQPSSQGKKKVDLGDWKRNIFANLPED
jgi:hypothetical protein